MLVCSAVPRSFAKERSSRQVVPEQAFEGWRLWIATDSFRGGVLMPLQCSMPGIELSVAAAADLAMSTQRTLQVSANAWTLVSSSNRIGHATLRLIVDTVSTADLEVQILVVKSGVPPGYLCL